MSHLNLRYSKIMIDYHMQWFKIIGPGKILPKKNVHFKTKVYC